jgi:hypothetical protein
LDDSNVLFLVGVHQDLGLLEAGVLSDSNGVFSFIYRVVLIVVLNLSPYFETVLSPSFNRIFKAFNFETDGSSRGNVRAGSDVLHNQEFAFKSAGKAREEVKLHLT